MITTLCRFYQGEEVYTFKNKFCEEAGFLACVSGVGNHEFDYGYEPLLNYARNLNHPIIVSNIDDTCASNSQGTHGEAELGSFFNKNVIIDVEGVSVGFVGYLTVETPLISSAPTCLIFSDELTVMTTEVAALKANNVDIIIGIGHAGLTKDLEIAAEIGDFDLIVGGHSHTFLWDEANMGAIPAQVCSLLRCM